MAGNFIKEMGRQVVIGVVLAVTGALLALMLSSGSQSEKVSVSQGDIVELKSRVDVLEKEGSPVVNARLKSVEDKVNDIYDVVVLKQLPRRGR